MLLEEIIKKLKLEVLDTIRDKVYTIIFKIDTEYYHPFVVAGLAEIIKYDEEFRLDYSYAFTPEFTYVVGKAKADIAANIIQQPNKTNVFSYEKLGEIVNELSILREFFKSFNLQIHDFKEDSFCFAFSNNAGFYGVSTDFMTILRREKDSKNDDQAG